MSDAIIVALITGAAAIIGNWLITRSTHEKDRDDRIRLDQKTADRLKVIESKLDEHNGYAKKFEQISGDIREIKVEIKHLMSRE